MMKRLFTTVALALAIWGGAGAESLDRELGTLASTRSNLMNIATALEMYATDHQGQYPTSLQTLEPNYLRKVPRQLSGSQEWNYRVDGKEFSLAESWEGFSRLGLPTQIHYTSERGLQQMELPAELIVFGPQLNLDGRWLRSSRGPGLSVSWETFDRKISARLLGLTSPEESFEQQKQRIVSDYIRWGWKADQGDFAKAVPKLVRPGWNLEGVYAVANQPGDKAIVLTRGERVVEVMVQDRDSRDALGSYVPLRQLLSQL